MLCPEGTLLTYIFSEHLPLAFHFVWGPGGGAQTKWNARGKFSVPRKHLGLAFYFVWGPPGPRFSGCQRELVYKYDLYVINFMTGTKSLYIHKLIYL